jgi:hypothetical protein
MSDAAALARISGEQVARLSETGAAPVQRLLGRYGLRLEVVPAGAAIPGSYWGEPEAGLIGGVLFAAPSTPVHSILHEAAHFICMDDARRALLHTDAGGDDAEEAAVCYLQTMLADALPGIGRHRMFADMDAWGYSFRLGATQAWFEHDAGDARAWLLGHGVIDETGRPTWRLRRDEAIGVRRQASAKQSE